MDETTEQRTQAGTGTDRSGYASIECKNDKGQLTKIIFNFNFSSNFCLQHNIMEVRGISLVVY